MAEQMVEPITPDIPTRFAHRGDFDAAVLFVMRACTRTLTLVDRDFRDWPLESVQGEALLAGLLGRERRVSVRMLVSDPDWLARRAPRLARLRRARPAAFECRQIPDDDFDGSGLMLCDRRHVLRRMHFGAFRGTLDTADAGRAAALSLHWDRVWQAAPACLPGTTLGL